MHLVVEGTDFIKQYLGFPGGSDGKESACKAGGPGLIPGLGRYPGEGNGNPFQYSFLENSRDGGAWQASLWGHKSQTRLSDCTTTITTRHLRSWTWIYPFS